MILTYEVLSLLVTALQRSLCLLLITIHRHMLYYLHFIDEDAKAQNVTGMKPSN